LDESPQSNPKQPINNVDPVKIHKIRLDTINVICLSCKKFLGHVAYSDGYSMWKINEIFPLCRECFTSKIGRIPDLYEYQKDQ